MVPGLCYADLLKLMHLRWPALLGARHQAGHQMGPDEDKLEGFGVTQMAQAYYPPALIYLIFIPRGVV